MSKQTSKSSATLPGMASASMEQPKEFNAVAKRLLRYFLPFQGRLLLAIGMTLISTLFSVLAPEILGTVTTALYRGWTTGSFDWDAIMATLTTLLVIYFVSQLFSFLQNFMMADITAKLIYNLRRDVIHKLNSLPLRFLDSKTHGELLSRITNDIETINSTLQQSFTQILSSIMLLIGIAVMMMNIHLAMSLAAFIVVPLALLISARIVKHSQQYFINQQAVMGDLNGHIEEMYTGYAVIKSFNYQTQAKHTFVDLNKKIQDNAWRAEFLSGTLMPVSTALGNLGYIAVAVLGCLFAIQGQIQVGQIQAFLQYVKQFNHPIGTLSSVAGTLQSTLAAAERVFEILDQPEETPDCAATVKARQLTGAVSIRQVTFSYQLGQPVIRNLNLNVQSGQTVAIVGPTGSGKTTLINLLMRFYEVDAGSIKIDGIDITAMKRDDLRSLFGMVLQDTWLFRGTIADNIAYGQHNATRQQVIAAAKAAHAHHFIQTLPDNYDMIINEDASNISQGQKQLLTIARAIIAQPTILILDEATSSVDTRTEVLIQSAMKQLMQARTSFIIAHRLSTVRTADIILVLNDGDIIEQGSHNDLIRKRGFYYQLYNSQFDDQA